MITFSDASNNVKLSFKVLGWEFPKITTGDDSSWLIVEAAIRTKDLAKKTSDPALEISDLKDISLWFKSLSEEEKPKYPELRFTEPCIEFLVKALDDNGATIEIVLSLEFNPTETDEEFRLQFSLLRSELKKKSKEFYAEYKRYLRTNSKTQTIPLELDGSVRKGD